MKALGGLLASLGMIFLAALVFDAVGRRTILPRATLLMLFGFVVGPAALDLLPDMTARWFPAVANMALVMVGFLIGGRLTLGELRERGASVVRISLAVVLVTFAVVCLGLFALGVPSAVALILGAVATATAPAATTDVVHASGVDTPFSRKLLDIVAVDDVWGLILFSLALAGASLVAGRDAAEALTHGVWDLGGALLLGVGLGVPMAYLTGRIDPGEPTLYEALGLVFLCGGIALLLEVSFLLASMTMRGRGEPGAPPHASLPRDRRHRVALHDALLRARRASLDLGVLAHAGSWLAAYVVLRVVGRVAGGWLGGSLKPADPLARRWMGIALLPKAGVALGMALVAAQQLADVGATILPVVVAATAFFELIGPVGTRISLRQTQAS